MACTNRSSHHLNDQSFRFQLTSSHSSLLALTPRSSLTSSNFRIRRDFLERVLRSRRRSIMDLGHLPRPWLNRGRGQKCPQFFRISETAGWRGVEKDFRHGNISLGSSQHVIMWNYWSMTSVVSYSKYGRENKFETYTHLFLWSDDDDSSERISFSKLNVKGCVSSQKRIWNHIFYELKFAFLILECDFFCRL